MTITLIVSDGTLQSSKLLRIIINDANTPSQTKQTPNNGNQIPDNSKQAPNNGKQQPLIMANKLQIMIINPQNLHQIILVGKIFISKYRRTKFFKVLSIVIFA